MDFILEMKIVDPKDDTRNIKVKVKSDQIKHLDEKYNIDLVSDTMTMLLEQYRNLQENKQK